MRNTRAFAAFATWKVAASMGAQAAKSAHARATQALLHGWNSWHTAWLESIDAEYARRCSLQRLLNLQLTHSWNAWATMASERSACLQLLRRSVCVLLNRQSALALACWREGCALRRHAQQSGAQVSRWLTDLC